ncbi:MAG: cell surface protein SprA, partial [Rhizobacter sp.]|nr:cell surface protein SprA [Chlorobiales bacterium]
KLTGLDRFGVNNTPGVTDNEFDYLRGVTIDELRGTIIFPFLRPFDKPIRLRLTQLGITDTTRIKQLVYNEVYDNEPIGNNSASSQTLKDRYIIRANFRSDVRASYDLGVNVVQGSVRVYANSGLLTEGADYVVDYQLGQVTIRNEAALKPGANLRIECEKNELAIIAAKSLLGVRAEYVFSDQLRIGGTFLEYSERPLQDKVRVGDEPILNRIYGFDFQYKTQLPFLTKLIDALPLISTKAESEITVRGEFAQVLPSHPGELNTTLDPQGVSYIDDFEGTKQILTLGLTFNQWALATPPDSIGVSKNTLGSVEGDSAISGYRSQLSWFNYDQGSTENLATKEIFPLRQAARSDNQIRTFNLTYFPYRRGPYNFSPDLNATIFDKPQNSWAGIMRRLPTYISNLQNQNVEFIEFWVKYERNLSDPDPKTGVVLINDPLNGAAVADSGYLNIDLGTISEDLLPTRTLNTEDGMPLNATQAADTTRFVFGKYGRELRGTAATTYINNQLNREQGGSGTEDVGIDGLPTSEEQTFFKPYVDALVAKLDQQILAEPDDLKRRRLQEARESVLRDPAGDDFFTATESSPDKNYFPYARINGQEGNGGDGQGTRQATNNFPDTEDLDASTNVSRDNSFFQYSVKLSTALYAQAEPTGEFISGGGAGNGGWIQFRIPLRAFKRKVGSIQDFRNITYARVWMSGFQTAARVRLATLDFVGSQWERPAGDSLISLSVINIEENGDRYALPPGIQRARDRRRVDENILANEQSLAVRVVDVKPRQSRAAFRNLSVQQINLNPYKRLRMFLHGGGGNIRYTSNGDAKPDYNAQAFIRFGADSLSNYYEYRIPLKPSDSTTTVPEDATQSSVDYQEAQRALWPDENEIDIDLAALAAFKQSKGGDSAFVRALEPSETVAPGTEVAIVGNPTLGSIRFLMIGVRNVGETNEVLTTELWANELRASGYNEEPGWAARADVSLKLADFGSISASVQRQTADFHDIQVRLNQLGGQNNSLSWGVSGNFNLDKFLPAEAQWSIPLLLSHSETVNEPKYSPGQTDITLEAAIARAIDDTLRKGASQEDAKSYGESIRNRARSITVSEQFSLPTIKKNAPSDYWLTQLTIDRLALSFNYTIQNARSPSIEFDQRWSWQFGINYGLQLPADAKFYFEPLRWLVNVPLLGAYKDFRLYYLPQTYTLSLGLARSRNQTKNAGAIDAPFSTSFSSTRAFSFGYRITDTFTFNYTSSLSASLNRLVLDIETNTERDNGETASLFFRDALAFDLGRDQNYTQGITLSWQPKMLELLSWIPLKFDYSSSYGWSNPSPDRPNLGLGNAAATNGQFRVSTTIQWRNFLERIGLRKDAGWSLGVPNAPSGQNPPGQTPGQSKSPGNAGRGTGVVPPPQLPPVAVLDTAGMSDEEKGVMLRIAEQEKLAAASAPLRQDSTRADSTRSITESGPSPLLTLGKDLKNIALTFLTFSDITVNFSSNNNITSSGLLGGTGWFNFFP